MFLLLFRDESLVSYGYHARIKVLSEGVQL